MSTTPLFDSHGTALRRGDIVDTEFGQALVVGFDRSIGRVLVRVPGTAGAHALLAGVVTVVLA
jgi:hypothetical protein